MSQQHRSRRLTMQCLCCLDSRKDGMWDLLEHFIRDSREPQPVEDGALRMLREAFDDRDACDELLARHAKRWELSRLALVDRNILRLGASELLREQTPFKVVISEALRLAREFSTADSSRFVNGVLDAVARELRGEENPERKKQDPEEAEKDPEATPIPETS